MITQGKKKTEETKYVSNDEVIEFWNKYLKELRLK